MSGVTVTIYTASWCSRCKDLKPLYAELIENNPDIEFKFVDVDTLDESNLPVVPSVVISGPGVSDIVLNGYNEIDSSLDMSL